MTALTLPPTRIGPATFAWGARTFVMGILNVTPDSFSGDGLLGRVRRPDSASGPSTRPGAMADEGADLLDIGGESTRPGHGPVDAATERARVVPVVAAVRAALPDDADQRRHDEARGRRGGPRGRGRPGQRRVGRRRGRARCRPRGRPPACPIVVMHNRAEPRTTDLMAEVVADLRAAARARRRGRGRPGRPDRRPGLRVRQDAPSTTSRCCATWPRCASSAGPILLGTSRKSTLGRVLDLPRRGAARGDPRHDRPRDRRPAPTSSASTTCAPTSARRADGRRRRPRPLAGRADRRRRPMSDRIVLAEHALRGPPRRTTTGSASAQPFEVDVELVLDLQPAGVDDDLDAHRRLRRVYDVVRADRRVDVVPAARGARRGDRPRILADFDVDEVASGSASRPSSSADRWTTPASRSSASRRRAEPAATAAGAASRRGYSSAGRVPRVT